MSEQSVQEELLQQVQEQKESLKELSEMLAVDPSEQLQQVFAALQPALFRKLSCSLVCIVRPCLQLYEELLAGLQETQLALAEYEPVINTKSGQPDNAAPALQRLCRSALCFKEQFAARTLTWLSPETCNQSRFLAPNGRWYLGRILTEDSSHATVHFAYPSEPYMLQSLQISTTALQPYQDQEPQQSLHTLPAGSSVFARLTPVGLFERAELHSVHPAASTATVTAFSSGIQHRIPLDQITTSVVLQDEGRWTEHASLGSGSDAGGDSDAAADSDFNDDDDEPVAHNPTALAVLDANLEASKVRTSHLAVEDA